MANLGMELWKFAIGILEAMDRVYNWLTSPIKISEFVIFGVTIWEEISFTPLAIGAPVIITILAISIISLVNPFT